MKIYFEDGELRHEYIHELYFVLKVAASAKTFEVLDASHGVGAVKNALNVFVKNSVVYTNSLIALDNKYAWNKELGVPEVYLRDNNFDWVRIDELTDRELREGHNLMKLYLAGEFGK